jgi:hypothetical protein
LFSVWLSAASRSLTEAGHYRLAPGDKLFFFLKRVNPQGDIQRAKAYNAGDQNPPAETSGYQTKGTALQPAEQEEARQEHRPQCHTTRLLRLRTKHILFSFRDKRCLFWRTKDP